MFGTFLTVDEEGNTKHVTKLTMTCHQNNKINQECTHFQMEDDHFNVES